MLYGYLNFERTVGPSYLQEPMIFYERVSKEGAVLGSVIWRISTHERTVIRHQNRLFDALRIVDRNLSGIYDNRRGSVPGAPHSRKP